ncbi:MAG: hypothetical protein ACR2PO_07105 [Methyloligellaceae bacterium]
MPDPWDIGFGAVMFGLALLALLVWFPNDIKGGFVETNHAGKLEPGDAFFPGLLVTGILVLSGCQLLSAILNRRQPPSGQADGKLSRDNLIFLILFHGIVATGLVLMFWLGPITTAIVNALSGGDVTYRQLVDTAPYKYVGYLAGALLITASLIAWAEGRLRPGALLTVLAVLAASILVFDVLLTNVQLPPNADY